MFIIRRIKNTRRILTECIVEKHKTKQYILYSQITEESLGHDLELRLLFDLDVQKASKPQVRGLTHTICQHKSVPLFTVIRLSLLYLSQKLLPKLLCFPWIYIFFGLLNISQFFSQLQIFAKGNSVKSISRNVVFCE